MSDHCYNVTTHGGIVITYDEQQSKFLFTVNGREKSAATLKEAKEKIDTQPKKPKKSFERIECWMGDAWSSKFERVTVTAIAEGLDYEKNPQVWISNPDPKAFSKRSKVSVTKIFPCNAVNDVQVEEVAELRRRMEELRKAIDKTFNAMEHLKVEKE